MAKSGTGEQIAALVGVVTGFTVIIGALLVGGLFGTAWLADYLYSGTFESESIGPAISFWQFVGGVVLFRLLRGFNFSTKKD